MIRKVRSRIYFAVEGEGEQSFIRLLQRFCDDQDLSLHLDVDVLGGGGYRKMLNKACRKRESKDKNRAKFSVLLVDADRDTENDDDWDISLLSLEAKKKKFHLCVQTPNQEGLIFCMIEGNESKKPSKKMVMKELKKHWPSYRKPVDFQILHKKFVYHDLVRASLFDQSIKNLLDLLGLKSI